MPGRAKILNMTTIFALSGSLRKGSFNSALLRALVAAAPSDVKIVTGSIRDVPAYDYDLEVSNFPKSVQELKDALASAQGLLLVTPEYNNTVPGVLKNVIDWMSRPPADMAKVFRNKPVAIMGASDGPGGTRLSQTAWLPVFRTLGMLPYYGSTLYMDRASSSFDEGGNLTDDKMKERLNKFAAGFRDFIKQGGQSTYR
jgi:chromate reductase